MATLSMSPRRHSGNRIGEVYGKVTVIRRADGRDAFGNGLWVILCECGKEKTVSAAVFTPHRQIRSCGCGRGRKGSNSKKFIDLSGQTFGQLKVIRYVGHRGGKNAWECECTCGKTSVASSSNLRRGNSTTCGCAHAKIGQLTTTHGETKGRNPSVEYTTYFSAFDRCTNRKNRKFRDYGGRGIEFRFTSFEQFLAEVGRRPSPKHSIERIQNSGHYEPGNVVWATKTVQNNNKRNNVFVTFRGETATVSMMARRYGRKPSLVRGRLDYGWCVHCSLMLEPLEYRGPGSRCTHPTLPKTAGTAKASRQPLATGTDCSPSQASPTG